MCSQVGYIDIPRIDFVPRSANHVRIISIIEREFIASFFCLIAKRTEQCYRNSGWDDVAFLSFQLYSQN